MPSTKSPLPDGVSFCKMHGFSAFFQVSVKSSYNVDKSVEFLVSKVSYDVMLNTAMLFPLQIAEIGPQDTYYIPQVEQVAQRRSEPSRCC